MPAIYCKLYLITFHYCTFIIPHFANIYSQTFVVFFIFIIIAYLEKNRNHMKFTFIALLLISTINSLAQHNRIVLGSLNNFSPYLQSEMDKMRLVIPKYGNLVLYNTEDRVPQWASNTNSSGGISPHILDENFVI